MARYDIIPFSIFLLFRKNASISLNQNGALKSILLRSHIILVLVEFVDKK